MILASRILQASHCHGTHHKLAFNALEYLQGPDKAWWKDFFWSQHAAYLKGAKAPDTEFKDYKNHVLHVRTGNWGEAPKAAREWYQRTVTELSKENWTEAAYSAGVLSHYLVDPLMSFNTGQTEIGNSIQSAFELSVAQSYDDLHDGIEEAGYEIDIVTSDSPNWLEEMLIAGANFAHQDYDLLVNEYDFKAGAEYPPAGLNVFCRGQLYDHLAYAQKLHAYVLDKAICEAGVNPPKRNLGLAAIGSLIKMPINGVLRKLSDTGEKRRVAKMYREFKRKGMVDRHLSSEVRVIRDLVAQEKPRAGMFSVVKDEVVSEGVAPLVGVDPEPEEFVIKPIVWPKSKLVTKPKVVAEPVRSQKPKAKKTPVAEPVQSQKPKAKKKSVAEPVQSQKPKAKKKPVVEPVQSQKPKAKKKPVVEPVQSQKPKSKPKKKPVVEPVRVTEPVSPAASSSGITNLIDIPSVGKRTASHLSKAGIHNVSEFLAADPYELARVIDIDAETMQTWHYQAELKLAMPTLRSHDIQILVQSGFYSVEMVAECSPHNLLIDVLPFVESEQGQKVIRPGNEPDFNEVEGWIQVAVEAVGIEERSAA